MGEWRSFEDLPILDELGEQLFEAPRATTRGSLSMRSTRRWRRANSRLLVAIVGMLTVASAAVAAGVLLGEPAPRTAGVGDPSAGPGAPLPAGAEVLRLRAQDPDGGPPWGIRVYRTGRSTACWQVGRIVGGHLGVLGANGAFGNDGLLHELPVERDECRPLDADGDLFAFQHVIALANGQTGAWSCHPHGMVQTRANQPRCRAGAVRLLRVGFLGPLGLAAVTGKRSIRVEPSQDGAFLFVDRVRDLRQRPHPAPIHARYRDGTRRALTDAPLLESVPSPAARTTPAPPGYTDPASTLPQPRDVRSTVKVTSRRLGPNTIYTVRYRAPVTVHRYGVDYAIAVTGPKQGSGPNCEAPMDFRGFNTNRNVRRGQWITAKITPGIARRWGQGWCPGRYHITVYLHDDSRTLGRYSFTAP